MNHFLTEQTIMKKVRFAKFTNLSEIKSHKDMLKSEIRNIWYKLDDLRIFKEGMKSNSDNDPLTSKKYYAIACGVHINTS